MVPETDVLSSGFCHKLVDSLNEDREDQTAPLSRAGATSPKYGFVFVFSSMGWRLANGVVGDGFSISW